MAFPTLPYTLKNNCKTPPLRWTSKGAGLDLAVNDNYVLHPHEKVKIPCGVSVKLPKDTFGLIMGRSSLRSGLILPGVIDEVCYLTHWSYTSKTLYMF